jgi:hypothetical protein
MRLKGILGRLERNEDIGNLPYFHCNSKNKYNTISPPIINLPRIPFEHQLKHHIRMMMLKRILGRLSKNGVFLFFF